MSLEAYALHIPGIMTREMIKAYGAKRVYASLAELARATAAKDFLPICMYPDHREHGDLDLPPEDILGWGKLRMEDGKVKTDLYFDLEKLTPAHYQMLRQLTKDNLSPAFTCHVVPNQGSFNGQPYDHEQINIDWKHIAVVSQGRCSDRDGCGLYMDVFDSVTMDSEKLERCVAQLKAKGHSDNSSWAICRASLNEPAADYINVDTGSPADTGSYTFVSVDTGTIYSGIDSMSAECVSKKMAAGMSEAEAKAACAGETKDAKIAQLEAQLEAKELILQHQADAQEKAKRTTMLEQLAALGMDKAKIEGKTTEVLEALLELQSHIPTLPGQPTGASTPGGPPSSVAEAEEDPELIPGLRMTIGVKDGLCNPTPIRVAMRDNKRMTLPEGEL